MDSLRFGAVQLSSQDDLAANLETASRLIGVARSKGAEVVLLPENFAFMGTEHEKRSIAEKLTGDGPIVRMLRSVAKEQGVIVIAGGMPEQSSDPARPFNTSAVFSAEGKLVTWYRKIHLFDVEVHDGASYHESASTSAGAEPEVISLGSPSAPFIVGLTVCYDLRFPELYRSLVDEGAEILTVPAAFTLATGKDHWKVLLQARAIESQAYVVAAAQCGSHPRGRRTFGKSCIIDPWGDVVAQASEGEGVVVADVERERIARVRRDLPSLKHRRL